MKSLDLFVYGTLMPGQRAESIIKNNLIKYVEEASVNASGMYTNSAFPFILIEDNTSLNNEIVRGIYLKLSGTPQEIDKQLKELDDYEGVDAGLFRRTQEKIFLKDSRVMAWVYSLTKPNFSRARMLEKVPENDWTKYR